MKAVTIVAMLVVAAGIWIEYQKDSSFASIDSGSLLIGAGSAVAISSFF
jgi:hypothetical protein